jgi:uncharacterized membrane protein YkvA (DUF1232 family)
VAEVEVRSNSSPCISSETEPQNHRAKFMSKADWRQRAQQLRNQAQVLYFLFKHPRSPRYIRLVAAFPVAYFFSPIQIIPNFIPVVGFADDFLVFFVSLRIIQRHAPADLLAECRDLADAAIARQLENAQSRIDYFPTLVAAAAIALVAGALVAAYIYRH